MKTVVISPYAKKYRENRPHPKNYPYFPAVIKGLKELGIKIIQVGIKDEPILDNIDEVKFDLSLDDLKKLLKSADTFIAVDSFVQHFAAYNKIPGIIIFSQSNPKIFGNPIHINLLKDEKYLRPDQFGIWESVQFNDDAFVAPQVVIDAVMKQIDLKKTEIIIPKPTITNNWQPFLFEPEQINKRGLKLHLGCGALYLYDFINIDIDNKLADLLANVNDLHMFGDNTVELILSSHILEHFYDAESIKVLQEWYRVLKPGGWLVIEMPDIEKCFKLFFEAKTDDEISHALVGVYGRPDWDIFNAHFTGYWPERLRKRLSDIGFKTIIEKQPREDNTKGRNLRMDAQK